MGTDSEVLNQNQEGSSLKKKKELGLDSQGIQKTMRWYHYFGDGAGQFALNSITGLVGMLTFFYTDKVGMAAGTVGTILLLSRIFDAFTDIGMGRLVDKTKSKYGKARPWLLWMIIPTFLAIILLFTVPVNASSTFNNIYVFLTVLFATAIVYTAVVIPYNSMMAIRTRSTEERGKMGISRTIFGYAVGMVIAILLIPITNMLGGDQRAWIIVAIILATLSSIFLYLAFLSNKEKVDVNLKDDSEDEVSLIESLKLLFKNKYWVIMLFVMSVINIMFVLNSSTGIYYTKHILGNENLIAIMGGIGLIPVVIGFAIIGPMIKKFGLTKTAQIGLLLGVIATGIRCFMPYSFTAALVFGSVATFATIPLMAIGNVLVNNTVEYGEWQSGKRLVGMVNSATSFGTKLGSGLGAAIIGWILAFGNYNGTLAIQPDSAITSILVLTVYLPFVLFVVCYLILRKYDLDQKYPQIVKDLEERKNVVYE